MPHLAGQPHAELGVGNVSWKEQVEWSLEEVGVFDQLDRFPSWRVFTVGYFALVNPRRYDLISSGMFTLEAKWFKIDELPKLAWDHKHIIDKALEKLKVRVLNKPIGFELLSEKFTLPQLHFMKLY